jgi:hypothetical protein
MMISTESASFVTFAVQITYVSSVAINIQRSINANVLASY